VESQEPTDLDVEQPAPDDPDALSISTITVQNKRGKEDVHLRAGGPDGQRLAKAIESAFDAVLKTQLQRQEFSGHIELVVLPITPPSERKHLTETLKQLRGICAELSTGEEPYRLTVTFQRDPSATAGNEAAAPTAPAVRAPGGSRTKIWVAAGLGVALAAVAAFAASRFLSSVTLPDAVEFGQRHLDKAMNWTRSGVSGAVYVTPGQKLPAAPLQVGVMVSTDHRTAAELDAWIRGEYNRSRTQHYYDSDAGDVSCKAGLASYGDDARAFMAVQVCATGDGKAACAESDEALEDSVLAPCLNGTSSCWVDACDMRKRADVGPLSALVLGVLGKR
jgi:DNA-binding HxlR family transcriptional regulator